MFVNFFILTTTLVIVNARNLNNEAIEDRAPVPKYDFTSHEDRFTELREELSDGLNARGDRGHHDQRTYDERYRHRQFHGSNSRKENERDSGNTGYDFSSTGTATNMNGENIFFRKKHGERSHAMGSRDSDFGLENFELESKIVESNIQQQRNMGKRFNSTKFMSDFEKYSPGLGFGNMQEHFPGSNFDARTNMDRKIYQNNNEQKNIFNSNVFNSGPTLIEKRTEERNIEELGVQIKDNENNFDSLASSHNQNFHNNNEKRTFSQQNRQNAELASRSNLNPEPNNALGKSTPRPSGRDNSAMDERPVFQTTAKIPVVDDKNKTNDEQWVWSDSSETKYSMPTPTTKSPTNSNATTPDVNDRAAFNGDKCPTGLVRMGSLCVTVD